MKSTTFQKRPRLVSKARLRKGLVRIASASDGIVDLAAAAELGLIDDAGLVALIPEEMRIQAWKLLGANTLLPVKAKEATLNGTHLTRTHRHLVEQAIPTVIGQVYWQEKAQMGISLAVAMDRDKFVRWVRKEIQIEGSQLNTSLHRKGYGDICCLVRGKQWWGRRLQG